MSRNNDDSTGNLLDYLYHQNYYKRINIDLSRQANTAIPQKISLTGKLEEDDGATILFIAEKQQKTFLNFSLDSLIITAMEHQKILNEPSDCKFITRD